MNASGNDWPARPATWADVMTDGEVALFMRLDLAGHSPESAKLALRHLRRTRGFPHAVRVTRKLMLTPRSAVEAWIGGMSSRLTKPNVPAGDVAGQALAERRVNGVSLGRNSLAS